MDKRCCCVKRKFENLQLLIGKLKILKDKYKNKGFIIIGVFGSYAEGKETAESDIDILYKLDDKFYNNYKGWEIYAEIDKIEKEFEKYFDKKIDMVNINALNDIGKKYISSKVVYV